MRSIRDIKIGSPGEKLMTIKVGINGFGRIGRCTLSHIAASGRDDIEVIKVNATGPLDTAAHLIKYDSVHGRFPGEVTTGEGTMNLGRGDMQMYSTYKMVKKPRHIWSAAPKRCCCQPLGKTSIRPSSLASMTVSLKPRTP